MGYVDQSGREVSQTALIEDVGRNGLRISSSLPVGPGQAVRFEADGFRGRGQVRYCELVDAGFAWGVEFSKGFEWDRTRWNPQHLFELPLEGPGG